MPRRLLTIEGVVQGVGFRPFVYSLATRLGLGGFVQNFGGSVRVEVEGETSALDVFLDELSRQAPFLARVCRQRCISVDELGESFFYIKASEDGSAGSVLISPDIATCEQCHAELFDPVDRRAGYAFLNCANCGPRLTIITAAPYDRSRTTMSEFPMCSRCLREYDDPANRRFHAQPIACPACGPRLTVLDAQGVPIATEEPIQYATDALRRGMVAAIKSLGGYHLVCDARNEIAVSRLRREKHRNVKPFAVMVDDISRARDLCNVSPSEEELLLSANRPIVLLRMRMGAVAESVAPRNPYLGVMLPYTPLHHLLTEAMGDTPLVMTSGNSSDEPITYVDDAAVTQLGSIADIFITHNRPIRTRCDDSVMRIIAKRPLPLRRSRGYAPAPITIPVVCPVPILALGGQSKAAFALGRDEQAILSHHLGDLDYYEAYEGYRQAVTHYERLFAFKPELIVHDRHPDYVTTRFAQEWLPPVRQFAVQHHHAHLASCLAEHQLNESAIGVIFDGTGYGDDGAVWGGEFLIGDLRSFRRAAHLRYVVLPGGECAIREPWRMALSYLMDAAVDDDILRRSGITAIAIDTVRQMIARQFNVQRTSSIGRLFDAVAAMIGIQLVVEYEGQAAAELEYLATDVVDDGSYPYGIIEPADALSKRDQPIQVDTRRLVSAIAEDVRGGQSASRIARRFHTTLVEIIVEICSRLRVETGIDTVVLSGGVFVNAILLSETIPRLEQKGFCVYRHELVPPNDGGLCLGQLAVAAASRLCDNQNGKDI